MARAFVAGIAGGVAAALMIAAIEWLAWEPPEAEGPFRPRVILTAREK